MLLRIVQQTDLTRDFITKSDSRNGKRKKEKKELTWLQQEFPRVEHMYVRSRHQILLLSYTKILSQEVPVRYKIILELISRVGKNPGFLKKPSPVGFFGFFGYFGFFGVF